MKGIFWVKQSLYLLLLLSFNIGAITTGHGESIANEGLDIIDPQFMPLEGETTVLAGLDKLTARVFSIEVPHNKEIKFHTLRIFVRGCKKNPPEEHPESAAFLEINEEKPGEPLKKLFSGWMFASTPSISALEHPIYNVWVADCRPREEKQLSDKKQ